MEEAKTFEDNYYTYRHCLTLVKMAKKTGKTQVNCDLLTSDYQDLLRKEGFQTNNEICRFYGGEKYYKQTKVSWLK
jgi:hypothetical protein